MNLPLSIASNSLFMSYSLSLVLPVKKLYTRSNISLKNADTLSGKLSFTLASFASIYFLNSSAKYSST